MFIYFNGGLSALELEFWLEETERHSRTGNISTPLFKSRVFCITFD